MIASLRADAHPDPIRVSLRMRDILGANSLKSFAMRRLNSNLGRFNARIREAAVWLEDINGPRGGNDKRCRLSLQLQTGGRIAVTAVAASGFSAIAKAADKARTVLNRRIKQEHSYQRRAHSAASRIAFEEEEKDIVLNKSPAVHDAHVNRVNTVPTSSESVRMGATVTIRDLQTGDLEEYTLVQPDHANILENRISTFTPAGRALYGRETGETVEIDAPGGTVQVRIESITEEPVVEA